MTDLQMQLKELLHKLQEIYKCKTGQPNQLLKGFLEDVNNLCEILFTKSDAYEKGDIEKCRQHMHLHHANM